MRRAQLHSHKCCIADKWQVAELQTKTTFRQYETLIFEFLHNWVSKTSKREDKMQILFGYNLLYTFLKYRSINVDAPRAYQSLNLFIESSEKILHTQKH